jgi:hypothetical protein
MFDVLADKQRMGRRRRAGIARISVHRDTNDNIFVEFFANFSREKHTTTIAVTGGERKKNTNCSNFKFYRLYHVWNLLTIFHINFHLMLQRLIFHS